MMFKILMLIMIIFSSCSGDRLFCAKVKPDKIKRSSLYGVKLRKRVPGPSSIESIRDRDSNGSHEIIVSKKPADADDWDCPRPGKQSNAKIIRENKKKIEKERKRRLSEKNNNESYTQTLLP